MDVSEIPESALVGEADELFLALDASEYSGNRASPDAPQLTGPV